LIVKELKEIDQAESIYRPQSKEGEFETIESKSEFFERVFDHFASGTVEQ